jgi:hypothetical protein
MYVEKISMSYEVYKFVRRNISELKDMFPNTTFTLSNEPGNYNIVIDSYNNEEFHRASKGTLRMVTKLINEETRKKMKRKIEKEKRMRRNADKAARDIMNRMQDNTTSNNENKNEFGISDDLLEKKLMNNMFYGLKVDAPCP